MTTAVSAFDDSLGFTKTRLNELFQSTLDQNIYSGSSSRLQELTKEVNAERNKDYEKMKLYNMSIKEIFINIGITLQDIINELMLFRTTNFKELILVFTKESRIMYIGIFLIICAFIIFLFSIFSTFELQFKQTET